MPLTPKTLKKLTALVLLAVTLMAGTACDWGSHSGSEPFKLPNGGEKAMNVLKSNHPAALDKEEQWDLSKGWVSQEDTNGNLQLIGDSIAPLTMWHTGEALGDSWFLSLRLTLSTVYEDKGVAEVLLASDKKMPLFRLGIGKSGGGFNQFYLSAGLSGKSVEILRSGWLPGNNREFFITLHKAPGKSPVRAAIYGDKGLVYSFDTVGYEQQAQRVASFGLSVTQAEAVVKRVALGADYKVSGEYVDMARQAMDDLLGHFWSGGPETGNILPTWNGYPSDILPDKRGGLWERGMIIFCMDSMYKISGDPVLKERIISEWRRIKELYTPEQLEAAGTNLHPAVDDCSWHAMLYLVCYEYSGDPDALARATGMVRKTYEHYGDDALGGGLWYNNERAYKSLYEVALLLDTWQIIKYTPDEELKTKLWDNYEWMESSLLRSDQAYWCEVNANGPVGKERPNDIREAGSVSFLGGNMGMAVLHARMYRDTGDKKYLDRAVRTAKAISKVFNNDGRYLCDRDAWVNGTFMQYYAVEVLTLPGIPEECIDRAFKTAASIFKNARTSDGYYGGCWNGPADGPGSRWSMIGSRPQQTMTSGSTVNVLMGAALLEAMTGK